MITRMGRYQRPRGSVPYVRGLPPGRAPRRRRHGNKTYAVRVKDQIGSGMMRNTDFDTEIGDIVNNYWIMGVTDAASDRERKALLIYFDVAQGACAPRMPQQARPRCQSRIPRAQAPRRTLGNQSPDGARRYFMLDGTFASIMMFLEALPSRGMGRNRRGLRSHGRNSSRHGNNYSRDSSARTSSVRTKGLRTLGNQSPDVARRYFMLDGTFASITMFLEALPSRGMGRKRRGLRSHGRNSSRHGNNYSRDSSARTSSVRTEGLPLKKRAMVLNRVRDLHHRAPRGRPRDAAVKEWKWHERTARRQWRPGDSCSPTCGRREDAAPARIRPPCTCPATARPTRRPLRRPSWPATPPARSILRRTRGQPGQLDLGLRRQPAPSGTRGRE